MSYIVETCLIACLMTVAAPPLHTAADAAESASIHPPLRVDVSPSYAVAPSPVRVQILVDPTEENRQLEVVVESDTYYRSSTIPLAGASEPLHHVVEFRSVPAGTYDVVVVLIDCKGHTRAMQRHRVVLVE